VSLQLSIEERASGGGVLRDTAGDTQQFAAFGGPVLPDRAWRLEHGTGSGQGNVWYLARRTVADGADDDIDLAGGVSDYRGVTITFTAVKRLLIRIVEPDGTKVLRVGPQGVTNGWQGPWGGTGATVYEMVLEETDHRNSFGGWVVTAGTGDILRIHNPGVDPVTYAIWIVGTQ
jgi:hypothetical protein